MTTDDILDEFDAWEQKSKSAKPDDILDEFDEWAQGHGATTPSIGIEPVLTPPKSGLQQGVDYSLPDLGLSSDVPGTTNVPMDFIPEEKELPELSPARALGVTKGGVETSPLQQEQIPTRAPRENTIAGGLLTGVEKSIPFFGAKGQDIDEIEKTHQGAVVVGEIAGTTVQGFAGGVGFGKVLAKTAIKKSPLVLSALSRVVPAVVQRGAMSTEQVVEGKEEVEGALYNSIIESGGGAAFSMIPEIVMPAGVAQAIAQPLADLIYQAGVDAIRGGNSRKEVFTKRWFKEQIPTLAMSLGFGVKDATGGKVFISDQKAMRNELKGVLGKAKPVEIKPEAAKQIESEFNEFQKQETAQEETKVVIKESQDDITKFKSGKAKGMLEGEGGFVGVGGESKTRNLIGKKVTDIKKGFKELMYVEGNLPKDVYEKKIESEGFVDAEIREIVFNTEEFGRTIKKVYKNKKMTDAEEAKLDQVLKGEIDYKNVDEKLVPVIKNMRSHVDALSQKMIDSGLIPDKLIPKFKDGMGHYLTRQFRVYKEPKWKDKVPVETRNIAQAFIKQEYAFKGKEISENIHTKMNELQVEQVKVQEDLNTQRIAQEEANIKFSKIDKRMLQLDTRLEKAKSLTELQQGRIDGIVDNLLYKEGAPLSTLSKGGKLGSKDLGVLKRRKVIPEEIRALWGEYKDVKTNYSQSVLKMAKLISNDRFLKGVQEEGTGKYFFDEPIVKDGVSYSVPLSGLMGKTMNPLSGGGKQTYTSKDIADAFAKANEKEVLPNYLRVYMKYFQMPVKYGKTILSHSSHARNTVSNTGFALMNGHYNISKAGKATSTTVADFFNTGTEGQRSYIKKLTKLGVINDGVFQKELQGMMKDASQQNLDDFIGKSYQDPIRETLKGIENLYKAEDSIWKIYAFENEMARYKKALPDKSESEIEKVSARIVRDTNPTYSKLPEAIKKLRRFPLVGSFVSFPYEVLRTTRNTIQQARKELSSTNPEIKKIGVQRMAGSIAALSAASAISLASAYQFGVNKEKDEAIRETLPPWSKNSPLLYLSSIKKGKGAYIDLAQIDPHAMLIKPIVAMIHGDNSIKTMASAIGELAEPFIGEEILSRKIIDIARNSDSSFNNRKIYKKSDDWDTKLLKVTSHIWKAYEPGSVSSIRRLAEAKRGEKGRTIPVEIGANLGLRVSNMDASQSIPYRVGDINRELREISSSKKDYGEEKYTEKMKLAYDKMFALLDASRKLGLSDDEFEEMITDKGISKKRAKLIIKSQYPEISYKVK